MKPLPSLTASISRGPEAGPRTKQTLVFSGAAQTVCMSYLLPDAHRGSAQAPVMEQHGVKVSLSCREEEGHMSTTEKDKNWLSSKIRN